MFITLTNIKNPRRPFPMHWRANSIEAVYYDDLLDATVVKVAGQNYSVAQTPDEILGLIGSRGEPRAADRHLLTLAADALVARQSVSQADLIKQLRSAAEHWRSAGSDAGPSEILTNALDECDKWKAAFMEWSDKTDWVQEQKDSFPFRTIGLHRADIMRKEIDRLRAEKELWRAAAGLTREQIWNIVYGFMKHDDQILFMAKVDAALEDRK
jgi:hypothetical protein